MSERKERGLDKEEEDHLERSTKEEDDDWCLSRMSRRRMKSGLRKTRSVLLWKSRGRNEVLGASLGGECSLDLCPSKEKEDKKVEKSEAMIGKDGGPINNVLVPEVDKFGPWMIPARLGRRRLGGDSRFDVLGEEVEKDEDDVMEEQEGGVKPNEGSNNTLNGSNVAKDMVVDDNPIQEGVKEVVEEKVEEVSPEDKGLFWGWIPKEKKGRQMEKVSGKEVIGGGAQVTRSNEGGQRNRKGVERVLIIRKDVISKGVGTSRKSGRILVKEGAKGGKDPLVSKSFTGILNDITNKEGRKGRSPDCASGGVQVKVVEHEKVVMHDNNLGTGSRTFPFLMRDMIRDNQIDVVALMETRSSGAKAEENMKNIGLDGCFKQDAVGYSGGIWVLWRTDKVDVEIIWAHHQMVHCRVKFSRENQFLCTFVYASPDCYKRDEAWELLRNLSTGIDGPWLVGGDFNVYLRVDEKKGGKDPNWRSMEKFNDCIEDCRLIDLGFNAEVFNLFSRKSDHRPVLIKLDGIEYGKKKDRPFRFMTSWLMDERFNDFMKDVWCEEKDWEEGEFEPFPVSECFPQVDEDVMNKVHSRVTDDEIKKAVFEMGMKWRLGNGIKVNFWKDKWVDGDFNMVEMATKSLSDSEMEEKVVDFLSNDCWDRIKLARYLPMEVVQRITTLCPPNAALGEDLVVWGGIVLRLVFGGCWLSLENGIYSSRLACRSGLVRNRVVFDDGNDNAAVLFCEVRARAVEMATCLGGNLDVARKEGVKKEDIFVRWVGPREDFVKVNVDGSCRGEEELAACGGVCRDLTGAWLWGFKRRIGRCSALEAELWGMLVGLEVARKKNLRKVELEADSLTVVKLVLEGCPREHFCNNLVVRIRFVMAEFEDCRVRHIFREANFVADFLAGVAHGGGLDLIILDDPDVECREFLVRDLFGVVWPRSVRV
ncbi:RNA-directed DNA polymerase [Senna tora]|uniref:RNA-directed DNA polymerase n=1 Tax=Senna tora TaxID=362788 RepID=A0A834T2J1_9FABA|nr:RNA-directed DNA polymerase [Senna tora]